MGDYEAEWDDVWDKNRKILPSIVNLGRKFYNKFFLRAILTDANSDTNFVELGCGTSTLIRLLSAHVRQITGIDISHNALNISARNCRDLSNVRFVKDDCTNLSIEPNQFDLVWSQGLIEHFTDPEKLVKEHLKVCKPGGVVMISVPPRCSYIYLWYKLTRPAFMRRFWPWTDQEFYTKSKFDRIMQNIGYSEDNYCIHRMNPFLGYIILRIVKKKEDSFFDN